MLQNLSIRNFLLIDELDLDFEKGFNVITGETGAGKSIILEAILFCLGAKIRRKVLTLHNKNISVVASFTDISPEIKEYLQNLGIEDLEVITLKRLESIDKVKKFFINDQLVSPKSVEYIAGYLLEYYGQNSHTSLLNSNTHIDILDEYGSLLAEVSQIEMSYKKIQNLKSQIAEFHANKDRVNTEIDYLTFVTDELSKLDIKEDEEEKLTTQRIDIKSLEKEKEQIIEIIKLVEEGGVENSLYNILRMLHKKNYQNENLQKATDLFETAQDNIENAKLILKDYLNTISISNLLEVEDRLFTIKDIIRKYKVPSTELTRFLKDSNKKLKELKDKITDESNLELKLKLIKNEYQIKATALSNLRKEAALKLSETVQSSLNELNMASAIFKIEVTDRKERGSKGLDNVRFIASTNPGMPSVPIDKAASGGELARLMLALKTALFNTNKKPFIIFDEIDTGLGGSAASAVGKHLKKLGAGAQVLVITHQAQIASRANRHILVTKKVTIDQTNIEVENLSPEKRINEIARMIAGSHASSGAYDAAKELLDFFRN